MRRASEIISVPHRDQNLQSQFKFSLLTKSLNARRLLQRESFKLNSNNDIKIAIEINFPYDSRSGELNKVSDLKSIA